MTVENATYIHQLDRTLPTNVDLISEGDDHIRLTKKTVQNTFPNVTGAVSATHIEISYLSGVTSGIQAQINTKAAKGGDTYTGAHNFSAATLTIAEPPPGDSSQLPATTAFVTATAFASALPLQTGNAGKVLSTDGSNAGWVDPATTHGHAIDKITGLQTALDGKAPSSHSHTTAQITGLDAALASAVLVTGNQIVGGVKTFTSRSSHAGAYTPASQPAYGASMTFDCAASNVFEPSTLTGNVSSITLSNAAAGQTVQIRFQQDGTGGRTVAAPSGAKIDGAISTAANRVSWLVMTYSARASRWEGNWLVVPA